MGPTQSAVPVRRRPHAHTPVSAPSLPRIDNPQNRYREFERYLGLPHTTWTDAAAEDLITQVLDRVLGHTLRFATYRHCLLYTSPSPRDS